MEGKPRARAVRDIRVEQQAFAHRSRNSETGFRWSAGRIRSASFVLVGGAIPGVVVFVIAPPVVRWICLAWLGGIAMLIHGLARRAKSEAVVLSIDHRGILDRRLMPARISWQEIAAICATDTSRSHVVDIELRWPKRTLAAAGWRTRIGTYCQVGYGVPAITISTLLLEANVSDVLHAVARHRPDLLHPMNRASLDHRH